MHRLSRACLTLVIAGLLTPGLMAQTYTNETTELIEQFGMRVPLVDEDNDAIITDRDFILYLIDKVFEDGLEDHNCDADIDEVDAVIGIARELASLGADFNNNGTVETVDIAHVTYNLGQLGARAREGDINGDAVVDAIDLFETCDRLGRTITIEPMQAAYTILEPFLDLEPWMATLPLPTEGPCPPPEHCGSALCKIKCINALGGSWTYRLFMVGFCGSQFEASTCCDVTKVLACNCSPEGFTLSCWVQAQGAFVTCLVTSPG